MTKYTVVSGIYVIAHIKSGKIYIGQAKDIRNRWSNHRSNLNRGNHGNVHLQSAWNKYGAKAFKFKILEYCPIEKLDEREQHYLDVYIPKGICYNLSKNAYYVQRGMVRSPEQRERIRNSLIGRPQSDETRAKRRATMIGRTHTQETKDKLREQKIGIAPSLNTRIAHLAALEKEWIIITPNGEEVTIKNLRKFCDENRLVRSCMTDVADGKRLHHKGWKCKRI